MGPRPSGYLRAPQSTDEAEEGLLNRQYNQRQYPDVSRIV